MFTFNKDPTLRFLERAHKRLMFSLFRRFTPAAFLLCESLQMAGGHARRSVVEPDAPPGAVEGHPAFQQDVPAYLQPGSQPHPELDDAGSGSCHLVSGSAS